MEEQTNPNPLPPALGRRAFLQGAGALSLGYAAAGLAGAHGAEESSTDKVSFPGLIPRLLNPDNLEFPFATLDSFITPTDRFYVRSHFAVPALDAKTWRLKVEGAVEKPLELSLDDLHQLPARTELALLECAGNARLFIKPKPAGLLWGLGAVGNAEWTGISLAAVLDKAGVRPDAVEVVLEGADAGEQTEFPNPYRTPGPIHFARSLPLARARRPEVLLAYQMNGAALTPAHGYPVRAVVPGWYGMASVKWLTRLLVVDQPYQGYFQTLDYAIFQRRHGLPTLVPVTELQVKAQVAQPTGEEVVPAGKEYRVHGAAWTGQSAVARVEVSTDGGKTWSDARLLHKAVPFTWRLWEYTWQVPAQAGKCILLARATDQEGKVQPMERDPDRRNAMISHVLPVEVEVR